MYNNNSIILFDGVCNLCNYSVQFILKHEKNQDIKFASLQSDFGQQFIEENKLSKTKYDSIILIENNNFYSKSEAALKIAKYLKFPFNLATIFKILPTFFRDYIYDYIANNRYKWFGKKATCFLPTNDILARFIL